jgi:cytochrome c
MHMTKLRTTRAIGLGFCGAMLVVEAASAQMPLPAAKPPDGAALFKQQCATCHTTNLTDPVRQGPPLLKIVGRQAGKADGFHYSAGFAKADFV